MRHPGIIVCAPDDWLMNQLRELTADRRWLLRQVRRPVSVHLSECLALPMVILLQFDLYDIATDSFALLAAARQANPDLAVVAVVDSKVADEDRAAWTAVLFDLGARLVLFPPLTRTIIEDALSGLMEASIRRQDMGGGAA